MSAITEALLDEVLSERKTEKELKAEKKWKTPVLCSYGDSVFCQSFYCDPRIFDADNVVRRFLRNSDFFHIWNKYPELPPEERVYYNYHYFTLWKISGLREDLLKIKIFFMLATKLMGLTKSYLYRGTDDNISMSFSEYEKNKHKRSKTKYDLAEGHKGGASSFSNYFFKTFIVEKHHGAQRKAVIAIQNDDLGDSSFKTDSQALTKITSHLNVFHVSHCSSRTCFPFCYKLLDDKTFSGSTRANQEKVYLSLSFLLDCLDISNLIESHFLIDNEYHSDIIKSYKFYEKLETNLMVQRVLEVAENFNTIQCWHFLPTDSLIITMHDDFDHRGIFCNSSHGALPTPVALRDFYSYVYPEIRNWLVNENKEHSKFLSEMAEKLKVQEEKEDLDYLTELRQEFNKMSPEKRTEFLETAEVGEPECNSVEFCQLPRKRKPSRSKKISFVATNLIDLRVENNKQFNEFHSQDGTKVNVTLDKWLYSSSGLLKLEVKRSDFLLYYHQWLNQETNTSFTFKTVSGIIFSFYKNDEMDNDSKYYVTISWPTGLLIRPVWTDSTVYVKQYYLKSCRKGWKIEEEESRCFLKNGQVIVFKSNGDYDVLCASGTKYSFYDSATIPRHEIVSTTGEVWEIRTKGPRRHRKKLITRNKVFIGIDPKTHEAFYKREDGLQCMLWQSGRLVTSYPDGTKLTSTPYFEQEEIDLEWTEEEKLYFEQLVFRYRSEHSVQEPRSRTILRHSSTSKTLETKPFEFEGFISVSCTYLSEHPKYSTVCVNQSQPLLRVTLPENLNIVIHEEGTYEVQKDKHSLKVDGSGAVFQTICHDCTDTSTIKLNLDSSDILCSCVDFFRKAFFTLRNGDITFHENQDSEDTKSDDRSESISNSALCSSGHAKSAATNQRCFALERDLSGVEFLHEDHVAYHISKQSTPSPFHELFHSDRKDKLKESEFANLSHTFSGQYSKAGYENWVMSYEDQLDSLPVNIKKKDLKELGSKQVTKNLFQYPFPKYQNCVPQQQKEKIKRNIKGPILIVNRTILCLSPEPNSVITELQNYVSEYQKQAKELYKSYRENKVEHDRQKDSRYIEMRLKKIAVTLCQSLHMYPHLCTQLPSTEKDIHKAGHFINKMQELKIHPYEVSSVLPNCKQIPVRLPSVRDFDCIREESESPRNNSM